MNNKSEYILYIELPKQYRYKTHLALVVRQRKSDEREGGFVVHEINIQDVNNTDMAKTFHKSLEDALKEFQERLQIYLDGFEHDYTQEQLQTSPEVTDSCTQEQTQGDKNMTNESEYIMYIELPKQRGTMHFALCLRQWKDNEWVVHEVDIKWVNENPYNASGGYMAGTYHESLDEALKTFQKRLQEYINQYTQYTKSFMV